MFGNSNFGFGGSGSGGGGGGTIGGGGTLNYVAMFNPDGTHITDAPIKIGDIVYRSAPINTGANSIAIGYDLNLSGTDNYLIGHTLNDGSGTEVYVFGSTLNIINAPIILGAVVLGFSNTIQGNGNTQGLYILGDSNVIEDNLFSSVVGEQNHLTRNSFVSTLGLYANITDSNTVESVGNNTNINLSNTIVNLGASNSFSSVSNFVNIGISNTLSSINSGVVIGQNNIHALSNEILIAINDLGLRLDVNGNLGVGVPYTETIKARTQIKGFDATTKSNQRLEPVNGVYEDTTGNTVNTTDATVTTLETIAIPNNSIVMINSNVTCRKTGGAGVGTIGQGNGYIRTVVAQNIAGVVTLGIIQSSYTSETIAPFDATFVISGTNVLLQVTGALNDNVTWNSITKKYNV